MNFNITLLPCNTTNCTYERQTAFDNNNAILGIDTSTTAVVFGNNDAGPNVSVFIGIGVGLALTGLCTFGVVAGAKRFKEAPEEEPLTKSQPEAEQIAEQVVPEP